MGYKLINVKLKYGNGANYGYAWKEYIHRICECANFTLDSESVTQYVYSASLNNNLYCCNYGAPQSGMTQGFYFGLPKQNSGNYTCYGFIFYVDSTTPQVSDGSYFKMIVDDSNNLVYCSKIYGNEKSNNPAYGFLLTNGGIKKMEDKEVYAPSASSGATPEQIATIEENDLWTSWQGAKKDDEIYRSNVLGYDMSNNIIIADHITQLKSSRVFHQFVPSSVASYKALTAAESAFEEIIIDGKRYVHLYLNWWIQVDEVKDETIEVVAP